MSHHPHDPATAATKARVRRVVRARLDEIDPEARAVAARRARAALRDRLRACLDACGTAHPTVALFAGTPREIDPWPLAASLRADGWTVLLPRVADASLDLVAVTADADLRPGHRGVREPAGPATDAQRLRRDLCAVVVPGVAFDRAGGRLGQGGGHYDRLLAHLAAADCRHIVVAVAQDEQVVTAVPREPHDVAVDVLVLPSGVHEVVRSGTSTTGA